MRCLVLVALLAGCLAGDDDYSGPVTLSVRGNVADVRFEGAGLLCGPSATCDGSRETICTVQHNRGTAIRIEAISPVCVPSGPAPLEWGPPCRDPLGAVCEFVLQYDVEIDATRLSQTP